MGCEYSPTRNVVTFPARGRSSILSGQVIDTGRSSDIRCRGSGRTSRCYARAAHHDYSCVNNDQQRSVLSVQGGALALILPSVPAVACVRLC